MMGGEEADEGVGAADEELELVGLEREVMAAGGRCRR
jgi:hypothetical protein